MATRTESIAALLCFNRVPATFSHLPSEALPRALGHIALLSSPKFYRGGCLPQESPVVSAHRKGIPRKHPWAPSKRGMRDLSGQPEQFQPWDDSFHAFGARALDRLEPGRSAGRYAPSCAAGLSLSEGKTSNEVAPQEFPDGRHPVAIDGRGCVARRVAVGVGAPLNPCGGDAGFFERLMIA